MTLLVTSFIAGLLTALAPCVLPLLPVVIGGSVAGKPSLRRALTITTSLGVSVFVFTLLLKVSTAFVSVPPSFWQWASGAIIFAVGIFMVFPNLWEKLAPSSLHLRGNRLLADGERRGGLKGDIIMGAALGPVFSSCSPTYFILLASVLPAHPSEGIAYLLAYVVGLTLALLAVAFVGQRIIEKLGFASDPRGIVKRIIGILFMLLGVSIVIGVDKTLQRALPGWAFGVTNLEQKIIQSGDMPQEVIKSDTNKSLNDMEKIVTVAKNSSMYQSAPELVSPDAYLNTDGNNITLASLRGKVVLVDFWTYSCINCQRTLPYMRAWDEKYRSDGLVIIGVHTPEFAFEHLEKNVADAMKKFGLKYPVVLDNEYKTWNAYGNRYWPHKYLVDIDGYIVYDHIGEGGYDDTERAIQDALAERAVRLDSQMMTDKSNVSVDAPTATGVGSPETYFGAWRNEYLANGMQSRVGEQTFVLADSPSINRLYFGGTWDIEYQFAKNISADATIMYKYTALNVYFVGSSTAEGTIVEIYQDGALVGSEGGSDVSKGIIKVSESRLYHIIKNREPGTHTLKMIIKSPGLEAYTFTFG